jgi:hypothetical protein
MFTHAAWVAGRTATSFHLEGKRLLQRRRLMFWRWALNLVLALLGLMYVNAAISCFWAADNPENLDPNSYIRTGYIDLIAACLLLTGAVVMFVKNIRRARKGQTESKGK